MKKTRLKKLMACVLTFAMASGWIPVIPAQAASSTHDGGTISTSQTVAPVYNQAVYEHIKDSGTLCPTDYIGTDGASGSIAPLFYHGTYQSHQQSLGYNGGSGFNLVTSTTLNAASEWNMQFPGTTSTWYGAVSTNTDVKMRLGGSLINGASMSLLSDDTVLGTNKGQSGKTIATTADFSFGNVLKTTGNIKNPYIALVDNTAPSIVNVSGGLDSLTITFDEILRWANGSARNSLGEYTITVKIANTKSGTESGELTYQASSVNLSKNSITFSLVSDAPPVGSYQILSIQASGNAAKDEKFEIYGIKQCYRYSIGINNNHSSANYGEHIYRYVNNAIKKIDEMENMSPLSDLAGNAVTLPGQQDLREYNITFDTQAPVLEEVYLTGSMIDETCELSKDQWPPDVDLSSVYAGWGDQLYFNLKFSEGMQQNSGQTITLNVQKDGSAVTLSNPTYLSVTNANGETFSVIRFGPFMTEEGMTGGQPIAITSLSGYYQDYASNDWNGEIPVCAQNIYLDAAAPTVTAEQVGGKDEDGNVNREPTILLTIDDGADGSGSLGLEGKIGLSAVSETAVDYKMAISDSMTVPADSEYTYKGKLGDGSVSWLSIPLYSNTRYLHLKLLGAENSIALKDLKVEYQIPDWAGNVNTSEAALVEPEYTIDEVAPTVTAPQITVTYNAATATIDSATWSGADFNQEDGLTAYYQWSDAQPADYSAGWNSAGNSTSGTWNLTVEDEYSETTTKTLWVYVEDASGNVSNMASSSCTLKLDKASTNFVLENDPLLPTDAPDLWVTANGSQTAYTYATISFDEASYLTKISSEEGAVALFPVASAVVDENGDTLAASDFNEILNAYYGEVTVSFESAFQDVDLAAGDDLSELINDGSYSGVEGSVTFRYAPDVDGVHNLSITGSSDWDTTENSVLFYQTLRGQSVEVQIENALQPDWGLSDVDFGESYLSLQYDGEEVYKTALSASETQTITLPALDYATGAYTITAQVTSKAGSVTTAELDTVLVLDNVQPENVGIWEAYITPGLSAPGIVQYDDNGNPILEFPTGSASWLYMEAYSTYVMEKTGDKDAGERIDELTLNMSGQREAMRADTFTTEVSGIQNFGFTISVDDTEQTIEGQSVGGVAAIYLWNPEFHASREEGIPAEGNSYSYSSGNALDNDTWTWDETTGIGSSTLNMTEGYYDMAADIGLKPGTTTLCYQVVMENGLESPVYQLQLHTSTETPIATLSTKGYEPKSNPGSGEFIAADVSLQNVFAANGLYTTAYLSKGDVEINGEDYPVMSNAELVELAQSGYYGTAYTDIGLAQSGSAPTTKYVLWDYVYYHLLPAAENAVVRLMSTGYETYGTQSENTSAVTFKYDYSAAGAFLLIDESGGSTLVFPQFTMTDDSGEAVPAVEGYTPRYKLIDGPVLYASVGKNISLGSQTYARVQMDAMVRNYEYMDVDKSTITFVDTDSGEDIKTVPLFAEDLPNDLGYMGGSMYGNEAQVYIASPATDDSSLVGTTYSTDFTVRMDLYDANLESISDTGWLRQYNSSTGEYDPINVSGLKYVSAQPSSVYCRDNGVTLYWGTYVRVDGETTYSPNITLPIFKNGTYTISFEDAYGNRFTDIPFEVTGFEGPDVTVSNLNKTSQPVTVSVDIPSGADYTSVNVTPADAGKATVTGDGTAHVTVEVLENTDLTIAWLDQSKTVSITNIYPADPTVIWSYGVSEETGEPDYNGGDVTAYVVDANGNWELIDPLTGALPQYTFTCGSGVTEYTFPSISTGELIAEDSYVDLGSFTVQLEVELYTGEMPAVSVDTRAPSVQLVPYAMQNSVVVSLPMTLTLEDTEVYDENSDADMANPALSPYEEYTAYTDSAEFADALGWASLFRFQIEVQDLSQTKIIVKNGLYAEEPDSYDSAASETVSNVTLSGNTLEVFGSAQFTLFVIDAMDNCVTIPMDIYNVGSAPVPVYTKIPTTTQEGDNAIKVELSQPEGFALSDIQITKVDGTAASEAVFTTNGVYTIDYTCIYLGQTVEGQIQISVNEIDNIPPSLLSTQWSANKVKATNQDVTVTLTFDKNITRVQSDLTPESVKVLLSGSKATVRYTDNTPELTLTFQGANGKWSDPVSLAEVSNIDRVAPKITASQPEISANGKSAVITFSADERVSFREASRVGTEFTRTVKENGTYEYNFSDMVGNVTTVSVDVENLVTETLTMSFSLSENGSGATQSPDELGDLSLGQTFYVSLNRPATVSFDRQKTAYTSGWLAMTMGDKSGGVIGATDAYGNTASAVFSNIIYPDVTAPKLALTQYTVYVSQSISAAELQEKLLANLQAVDDRAGDVTMTVSMPDVITAGDYQVTYAAQDKAGNQAELTGKLTIYSGAVPSVWVDGEFVERDRIYLAERDDALQLKVDMQDQPYTVVYKKNIKTVAQMKIGSTPLELTDDTVTLPFSGITGYYTVCISTQDHDQYRIVIYVK